MQQFLVVVGFGEIPQGVPNGWRGLEETGCRVALPFSAVVSLLGYSGSGRPFRAPMQEQTLAVLRHAVMGGVQNPIVLHYPITVLAKLPDDFFEKSPCSPIVRPRTFSNTK